MTMTDPHEIQCLEHIFNRAGYNFPANVYLGFHDAAGVPETGTPTNEPYTGANRTAIPFGNPAASAEIQNSTELNINTSTWTSNPQLQYFSISNNQTAGTPVQWYGQLTTFIDFTINDIINVPVGNITVRFYDSGGGSAGNEISVAAADAWLEHSLGQANWTGITQQPTVSLHTTGGAEMTQGGYSRVNFEANNAPTANTPWHDISHTNTLTFTDIRENLERWQINQTVIAADTEMFRQPQSATVTPGSTITANPGTLSCGVQ